MQYYFDVESFFRLWNSSMWKHTLSDGNFFRSNGSSNSPFSPTFLDKSIDKVVNRDPSQSTCIRLHNLERNCKLYIRNKGVKWTHLASKWSEPIKIFVYITPKIFKLNILAEWLYMCYLKFCNFVCHAIIFINS